jgi:CARDB
MNRVDSKVRRTSSVLTALGLIAICAGSAVAQVHSTFEPGSPEARNRPAAGAPIPGPEDEVVVARKIEPDSGICVDPAKKKRKEVKPIRINHRQTDIPVYDIDPNAMRAPAMDDTANDYTRAQPLFQNFESMGPNDLTPPDPDLATDGQHIVVVTNDDFAVYDLCGNVLFNVDAEDYFGTDTAYLLFDPKVVYDPWANRWVMMWHKKRDSTQESTMILAYTAGTTPFGLTGAGVLFYEINMVQDNGTADESWADYYDLGYSANTINFAGNQFRWAGGFRWGRIRYATSTDFYNGGSTTFSGYSNLVNPDGSQTSTPRAVKQQWAWSEGGNSIDGLFINSRGGGGDRLTLRKLRNVAGAASLTAADINVGAYTQPPDAVQPNGLTLDTINCRLMTATVSGNTLNNNAIELFTALNTGFNSGTDVRIHLFKINPVANSLLWEEQFGVDGQDYWFASAAVDYSGSAVWVFSRTSSTGVEPEARYIDYNKGVFSSASSLLRTGDGNYNGFRWGDYLGAQMDWADYSENFNDPGRPSKFWMVGEYGEVNSWNTHVGATSVYSQGDLNAVTPTTDWNVTRDEGGFSGTINRAYTLDHIGDVGSAYEVVGLPTWLSASSDYGRYDEDNATVTLTIVNSVANNLAYGNYVANVTIRDCFNGGNSFVRQVNLTVEAPDLEVVSIDATNGTYNPGGITPVTVTYRNNGNKATGTFTANFYASTNTTISTADNLMDDRSYSSLAPGASTTRNHNLNTACVPAEGLYYIGVIATVTGDADTSDNDGFDATRVRIEYCPADVDESCFVDTEDYSTFVKWFEAGIIEADFDGTGFVDTDDFTAFVIAFESGC